MQTTNLLSTVPTWVPLVSKLGATPARDYMFMHSTTLPAGITVHSYKHVDTRAYLHIDDLGNEFTYDAVANNYSPA